MLPALVCALALLHAAPLAAKDGRGDGPIVLTNDDVVRIGGTVQTPEPATTERRPTQRTSAATTAERERVADSWQEEYYRLKAEALRRAIERGEPIEDDAAYAANGDAPPAKADEAPQRRSRPTCLYGHRGELIFKPAGMDCLENRRLDASRRDETQGSRDHASCLYGLQGEILHQPIGRTCPKRTR